MKSKWNGMRTIFIVFLIFSQFLIFIVKALSQRKVRTFSVPFTKKAKFEHRLSAGIELRSVLRKFPLNRSEERILSSGSIYKLRGTHRACCMFGLEGTLMDTTPLLHHSFRILANELGLSPPSLTDIVSCCGLPLYEYFIAARWPMEVCRSVDIETKFINVIEKMLRAGMRLELKGGALEALDEWMLIDESFDENHDHSGQIRIFSALPRKVATMLLAANPTLLKLCISKKLSSRLLVASEQFESTENLLVQCIAESSRNPSLIVIVDSNAETLRHAKRMGMACVGVPIETTKHSALGVADKIVPSLHEMTMDVGLSVILGSFGRNVGPLAESASMTDIPTRRVRSQSVSSASMDRNRGLQDTFSDEFDNDRT